MGMIICFPSLGEEISWALVISSYKPPGRITIKKQVGRVNSYETKYTEWTNKTSLGIL